MLTARGSGWIRVLGLELGADDYLPKPFNDRELVLGAHQGQYAFPTGARTAAGRRQRLADAGSRCAKP